MLTPNVTSAVPFLAVTNMSQSLRFYVDGLGATVKRRWEVDGQIRWCSLALGAAELMLQQFPTAGHDARSFAEPRGSGVTLCFMCHDATKVYLTATANGLAPSRPEVGNGMWVTSLADPDGYRLDFESVTSVPEGTTFDSAAPRA